MLRRLRQAPEKLFLGRVKPALKFAERTAQCDLPVHFAGVVNEYFDPVPDAKQSESDPEKVEARSKNPPAVRTVARTILTVRLRLADAGSI